MSEQSRHYLVLGAGRSGRAAIELLRRLGARVRVYDRDPRRLEDLPLDVARVSGGALPDLDGYDGVVTSPGIAVPEHPGLMPEIDLAAPHIHTPVIGVTGTNGKSTTVVLTGEMLRRSGLAVPIGGNLGDPLCALVGAPADALVAELSSFQLELARALHVQIGVLLNLAPDHLDRHGSLEAYGEAKARLLALQRATDTLIVNLDDGWARETARRAAGRVLGFSTRTVLERGACLEGEELVLRDPDGRELLRVPREKLSDACRATVENALASMLAASLAGATPEAIRERLECFAGLPHRGRLVCVRRGVRYVDDSKATNPAAAARSLSSQPRGCVWIAGGRNKGLDLATLADAAEGLRAAIFFGESRSALAAAVPNASEIVEVPSLEQAVAAAAERAVRGTTVLLAPACASHDQFASFEERGRRFAELARALPEEAPC
ncbi:MAG: UDP-N-acetylmuramoyl-L-alanine--D-glutamate ligase [Myxococcota bacterium]